MVQRVQRRAQLRVLVLVLLVLVQLAAPTPKWRRESGRGVVLDVLVLGAGLLSVAVQGWSRLGATCLGNTAGARVSDARGLYRADQERQSFGSWRRLLP